MSDIYLHDDTSSLLDNRFIVVIGDSIQRGVYKDLVLLLQKNKYLSDKQLRSKGEFCFEGDTLIEGGQKGAMTNGVSYREVRQYQTPFHLIRFYFVTRCYNSYMESILADLDKDPKPDVIIMNSCLWDISRYGVSSVDDYKTNLEKLFTRFNEVLPESCLVIWNTTLPISKHARGGFLIPEVEFMNSSLRLDILEANFFAHKLAVSHGYDVLDVHYFLRHQLQRRAGDGVHWDMTAHRRITNLILTHIANAWCKNTPKHAAELFKSRPANANVNRNQNIQGQPKSEYLERNVTFGQSGFSVSVRNHAKQKASELNINSHSSPVLSRNWSPNTFNNHLNNYRNYDRVYEDEIAQQHNIDRYGGPIRRLDYHHSQAPTMMQVGKQQCVSSLSWEPYANKEYSSNMRHQSSYCRGNPYRYSVAERHLAYKY